MLLILSYFLFPVGANSKRNTQIKNKHAKDRLFINQNEKKATQSPQALCYMKHEKESSPSYNFRMYNILNLDPPFGKLTH